MRPLGRLFDLTQGVGMMLPFPWPIPITGLRITGSEDLFIEHMPASRAPIDLAARSWPIPPVNTTLEGSLQLYIDMLPTRRVFDQIFEPAGIGMNITGAVLVFTI